MRRNVEIVSVILFVVIVLVALAIWILKFKLPEHEMNLYERKATADAMLKGASVHANGVVFIPESVVNGKIVYKRCDLPSVEVPVQDQNQEPTKSPNEYDTLLDILYQSKAINGADSKRIIPGNQYTSGGNWQDAINLAKSNGWAWVIRDGTKNVTEVKGDGMTLDKMIKIVRAAPAVKALPRSSERVA